MMRAEDQGEIAEEQETGATQLRDFGDVLSVIREHHDIGIHRQICICEIYDILMTYSTL